jgi:hypothetical protein
MRLPISRGVLLLVVLLVLPQLGAAEDPSPKEKEARKAILGTWMTRVPDGKFKPVIWLIFSEDGTGQLQTFCPTDKTDRKGSILCSGFSYEVQVDGKQGILSLTDCGGLLNYQATIQFVATDKGLQLRGGKALRKGKDKVGLDLTGTWTHPLDNRYSAMGIGPPGIGYCQMDDVTFDSSIGRLPWEEGKPDTERDGPADKPREEG